MSPYLSSQSTAKFYFSSKRFVTLWKVDSPRVTWLGGRASTRPLPPGFCRSRRGIYGQSCRLPIARILHWSSLPNYRELDWGLKLFRKGEVFLIMIFNLTFSQFEDVSLNCALWLLDNSGLAEHPEAKSSPIPIVRTLSAQVSNVDIYLFTLAYVHTTPDEISTGQKKDWLDTWLTRDRFHIFALSELGV